MNQPWRARRIPLAWLLLTRQPARLAVALVGIALAGLVMFIQLGLRDGGTGWAHPYYWAFYQVISP